MKVLQIHNKYLHYGGEDAVVENEYKLLQKNGVVINQLFFDNTKINPLKLFNNEKSYQATQKAINDFKPDVVHVHNIFYTATTSVLKAANDNNVPVVITLHNFRLVCANGLFLRNSKVCLKCKDLTYPIHGAINKCFQDSYLKSAMLSMLIGTNKKRNIWNKYLDKVIVLTPFVKDIFLDTKLGFVEKDIIVKSNSTDDFFNQTDSKENIQSGYLFIGRLSKEKGVDVIVEAFNKMPEFKLEIIGDGELGDHLKTKANKNIIFHGKQSRDFIKDKLTKTKALVFPSIWYEGLPNTIIESFSSGTPILASNISNINEIVSDNYNGKLFKTGSVSSIIDVVKEFDILREVDYENYKNNARNTYLKKYTHEINFENLMNIYSKLVEK